MTKIDLTQRDDLRKAIVKALEEIFERVFDYSAHYGPDFEMMEVYFKDATSGTESSIRHY